MFKNSLSSIVCLQTIDTPFEVPDYEFSFISTCRGKRIFRKAFSLEELIGEEIAKFMNRESIHYFLLKKDGILQLGSYPIIEREECYPNDLKEDILFSENDFDGDDRYENYVPFFLEQSKNPINRDKFLDDLYKTFAIDTYMRQKDRCSCNCMMYQDNNNLCWAPMYDYADSFSKFENIKEELNNYFYENPFFIMNLVDYSDFLDLYPDFNNYLKRIQNVDLQKVLRTIQSKYCFRYSNELLDYWKRQEELSQTVLQKVIR